MGSPQVSCAYCGEVIGVYEPMVAVIDGRARNTSLAAEAETFEAAGALRYHRSCYAKTVD
jgi:hypothetical protein